MRPGANDAIAEGCAPGEFSGGSAPAPSAPLPLSPDPRSGIRLIGGLAPGGSWSPPELPCGARWCGGLVAPRFFSSRVARAHGARGSALEQNEGNCLFCLFCL